MTTFHRKTISEEGKPDRIFASFDGIEWWEVFSWEAMEKKAWPGENPMISKIPEDDSP